LAIWKPNWNGGDESLLQFSYRKMKDDYPKLFTAPLGNNSEFCHRAFANPCAMKKKSRSWSCVRLWKLGY
jgi:hypothetical protein